MSSLQAWSFSKRHNSTAFPAIDPLYNVDVKLKEGCSILHPSWYIQGNIVGWKNVTYVLWEGRYYYVRDMILEHNTLFRLDASVDVLATYQQYILSSVQFVERADQHYDPFISDNYVSQSNLIHTPDVTVGDTPPNFSIEGTYVVRTVGKSATQNATGISSWALSRSEVASLISSTFDESHYDFLSDTSVKSFFNPFQYILDVKYFPFSKQAFGGSSERIYLGWWDTGIDATPVLNPSISYSQDIAIPSGEYNDFRRYDSNWSTIRIWIPGCGLHFFNVSELGVGFRIRFDIDVATGQCLVKIHPNARESGYVAVFSGMFCSPVSIGQLDNNTASLITTGLTTVGALSSGNFLGAAGSAVNTIQNFLQPTASVNGTAGNMTTLTDTIRVIVTLTQYQSRDIPSGVAGRPVMRRLQLNTFSGYVKCGNPSIFAPATDTEIQEINNLLAEGVYIDVP